MGSYFSTPPSLDCSNDFEKLLLELSYQGYLVGDSIYRLLKGESPLDAEGRADVFVFRQSFSDFDAHGRLQLEGGVKQLLGDVEFDIYTWEPREGKGRDNPTIIHMCHAPFYYESSLVNRSYYLYQGEIRATFSYRERVNKNSCSSKLVLIHHHFDPRAILSLEETGTAAYVRGRGPQEEYSNHLLLPDWSTGGSINCHNPREIITDFVQGYYDRRVKGFIKELDESGIVCKSALPLAKGSSVDGSLEQLLDMDDEAPSNSQHLRVSVVRFSSSLPHKQCMELITAAAKKWNIVGEKEGEPLQTPPAVEKQGSLLSFSFTVEGMKMHREVTESYHDRRVAAYCGQGSHYVLHAELS